MYGRTWKYFSEDISLEEGKGKYRDLLKKYHPDLNNGDDTICKEVIAEFELFVKFRMYHAFNEAGDEKTGTNNAGVFADILNKVMAFNIRVEIIGYWIYCFDAYEYRAELAKLGFWFAASKKAWVYSGGRKHKITPRYNIEGVRNKWGSQMIRDKDKAMQIEG